MAVAPPTEQMRELTATDSQLRRQSQASGAHVGIRQRQWGIAARVDSSVSRSTRRTVYLDRIFRVAEV